MGKIATVANVIAITGKSAGSYSTKRCATYSIATELGWQKPSNLGITSETAQRLISKDTLEFDTYVFKVSGTLIQNAAKTGKIYVGSTTTLSVNNSSKSYDVATNAIAIEVIANAVTVSSGKVSNVQGKTLYLFVGNPTSSLNVGLSCFGKFIVPAKGNDASVTSIKS